MTVSPPILFSLTCVPPSLLLIIKSNSPHFLPKMLYANPFQARVVSEQRFPSLVKWGGTFSPFTVLINVSHLFKKDKKKRHPPPMHGLKTSYMSQELKPELSNNLERWEGWKWERGPRGRGHMHTYGWFMLVYDRNQHNIVKQLSFN